MGESLYSADNGIPTLNRDNPEKATESTAANNKYSKKFIISNKLNRTVETRAGSKTRQEDANEDQEHGTSVNTKHDTAFKLGPKF